MSGNKLRILALVHRHLIPPDTVEEGTDTTAAPWRTEYDVISTLTAMGHEVQPLGVHDDLGDIRRMAAEWKPHIAFNLLEGFDDVTIFDQNVVVAPRTSEAAVHRLQPARIAPGARQVAFEEAARLSPHCGAGLRSVPHRPPGPAAQAPHVSADREVADPGSVDRHLPGVGRRHRREAEGARRLHSRQHRNRGHRRSSTSRGASCMSASSAISCCRRCRSGSCSSRICRQRRSGSPPIA